MKEAQQRATGLLCLFFLCCLLAGPGGARAGQPALSGSKAPIEITADRLDIDQKQKKAVFRGRVVARQEKMTIEAETITIFFSGKNNEVKEIVAAGRQVRIDFKGKTATCAKSTYIAAGNKIVLTGKPVLKDGKNVITGDKIIFFLDEERSIVEGKSNSRVKTTIYPGQQGLFDRQ
ncbi:MAG: lipopolysaccharide transport periplasmic protein LptA [Deltaproteobacteria bacterium]|nr:lipopolysaccharide transport periplasmic protein LptA [Deltaproteobacteria bacterium]